MFVAGSEITANGVTSAPVPDVVGTHTRRARAPRTGKRKARLRMSENFCRMSAKSMSGCSYSSHITLAASIGEPPPSAMIVSGRKSRIRRAPRWTESMLGSGSTLSMIWRVTGWGRRCRTRLTRSTKPRRVMVASVTIVTRWTSGMDAR